MPAVHTDMKMKKSEDEKSLQEYSENKVLSNNILPPASLFPPTSWILCKRHFFCEKVESADEFS